MLASSLQKILRKQQTKSVLKVRTSKAKGKYLTFGREVKKKAQVICA